MSNNETPLTGPRGAMSTKTKIETENIEHYVTTEEMQRTISKGGIVLMRTKADDLTIWQSAKRHKRASLLAMVAAFSASLDGYRKTRSPGSIY